MSKCEREWVMSNELVADMLEALEQMVDGIRANFPPNSVGGGVGLTPCLIWMNQWL